MPNITFGLLCLSSAIWQFGFAMESLSTLEKTALFWNRFVYLGVPFIAPTMYHLSVCFLGLKKQKKIVAAFYILAVIFVFLSWNDRFISGLRKYFWGYYTKVGILHHFFLIIWLTGGIIAMLNLFRGFKRKDSPLEHQRKRYMFLALVIALLGTFDFLPAYGISVYPFGYLPVVICLSIIAYAIIKYRLMDIKVTATRTGVFIAVYAMVLGLPFLFAKFGQLVLKGVLGNSWWMAPMVLIALFATLGPFAYNFLQRRAEALFLRERMMFQEALKEMARQMTRIHSLQELSGLLTGVFIRKVKVKYIGIYVSISQGEDFLLYTEGGEKKGLIDKVSSRSKLVFYLEEKQDILVYDEILRHSQVGKDSALDGILDEMKGLRAPIILPSFLSNRLVAFLILGDKRSGKVYTAEDINTFSLLMPQLALAIDNAMLYDNMEKQIKERTRKLVAVQNQLVQAEKLATVGTLAGGVAHEINNPLTAILTNIQMLLSSGNTPDRESLELIEEATQRCRNIVKKLMVYARKPKEDVSFEEVDVLSLVKNVVSFLSYQLEQENIKINIDAQGDVFTTLGSRNELEQVLTNLILNGRDAVRRNNKPGIITVVLDKTEGGLRIKIRDNGCGIPSEIVSKVFDPFFTTKDVGKGLGLGLSICQAIIEKHKGSVSVKSELGKGSEFIIALPAMRKIH